MNQICKTWEIHVPTMFPLYIYIYIYIYIYTYIIYIMLSIVPYKAHSLLIVRISSIDISRARVSQGTEPTRVWYAHHTGSMDMIIIEWLHAAIPYFFWAWSHGTSSRAGWGCMARSPNVTHFIKFE